MADDVEVELEEGTLGNRSLSVALGVLVVLSLLVLGYYYRRPAGTDLMAVPTPSAHVSESPAEVLPPPVETGGVIKVYVTGEVKKPGVVSLTPGSRVEDAVAKAGGMTPEADPLAINLASRLKDEQMIVVPARGASPSPTAVVTPQEVPPAEPVPPVEPPPPEQPPVAPPPPGPQSGTWNQYLDSKPSKVSLNRGTQAELEALPGVGPKTAADIIAFRKSKPFKSVQDLLEVPGIGDKKLETIRPYVDL